MREQVLEAIRRAGGLDDRRIQEALQEEADSGLTLDKVLYTKGFLTEEQALQVIGGALGLRYLPELKNIQVPESFVQAVPVQFARSHNLVAVQHDDGTFRVATAAPFDLHPLDELAGLLGADVDRVLSPRAEITALLNKAYRNKGGSVEEALVGLEGEDEENLTITMEEEESEDLLDLANRAPIIKLVNMFLFQALRMRASDVHIQPYPDRLAVRYRIDGILYDMESPPKKYQEAIISRIKIMGRMDIAEKRLPQDGRATIKIGDGVVDVRISSVPTSNGERLVLRLLDKTARLYTMEDLGLDQRHRDILERYIQFTHGILLVTGPTGSGKTTTLYACLSRLNSQERNVMTIEDPIEYNIGGISQIQVSTKKGLTFASGLRSLLRQDPDVMMVGEIRDHETAEIAIRAALTGHLVFSTVHTNDAPSTVTRLLDIGIEPYLVASSLLLVIAQRLVRVLCENCMELVVPDAVTLKKLEQVGISPDALPEGKIAIGRGCANCFSTGYVDRTALYEMLPIDDRVQEQIMDRTGATTIKRSSLERGAMRTLRQDGTQKILQRRTTVDEVLRVTQLDVV